MNVLIASSLQETSQELSQTIGQLLPSAQYLHANTAESAMEQFRKQRIDIALVDLQLICPSPAAAALLKLTSPPKMVFAKVSEQFQSAVCLPAPGMLLTFDGSTLHSEEFVTSEFDRQNLAPESTLQIWATREGCSEPVNARDIVVAMARAGKVEVRDVNSRLYLVRDRLKDLEQRLEPENFYRIHKSYLANLSLVSEVLPCSTGGFILRMMDTGGTQLPVSRRYATRLRRRTGWEIGWVRETSDKHTPLKEE